MNTSYGGYVLRDQDGYQVLESRQLPAEPVGWPDPQLGQFNAATFNTHNFDAGSTAAHTAKVANTLFRLGGPTFVALQEIDAAAVITGLLDQLQSAGLPYAWAASHPDAGGHGVALLWRSDQVSQAPVSTSYQGCSEVGSPSSTYDPLYANCRATGQYPLFSRRPVVLTATVSIAGLEQQIVVIANHFKSQLEEEGSDQRRLEQGDFIHDLAQTFIAAGSSQVLVMGDLNDLESSPALQALTSDGVLDNTWFRLPAAQRFSYNYRGRSQVLDHILASPDLSARLVGFNPLRFNSDFPENPYQSQSAIPWFTSDHDPLAATFAQADLFLHPLYLPQVSRQN